MDAETLFWLAFSIYAVGYFVAAVALTRNWYKHFDERTLDGAAWGMMGAFLWPLFIPVALMKKVASIGF